MRLSELHPELTKPMVGLALRYLSFDCPHCRQPGLVRIPVAVDEAPEGVDPGHVWLWDGNENLDQLTVSPSINIQGHWHGHVRDGEVTNA